MVDIKREAEEFDMRRLPRFSPPSGEAYPHPPLPWYAAIFRRTGFFLIYNFRTMLILATLTFAAYYFRESIFDNATFAQEATTEDWASIFAVLLFLRYSRLIVNMWGYWFAYRPSPIAANPAWTPKDVSVILPTVDPNNPKFNECIRSILDNRPAAVLIVTVGAAMRESLERIVERHRRAHPDVEIGISAVLHPSKRRQVAHAVPHVRTEFTVLADDHVFWPSKNFLHAALAPFEDRRVGVVATHKRVRRTTPGRWSVASVLNMIGCFYLERHNWELAASNAIDGGVFVVSGRTAVYRSRLLKATDLMRRFCDERFFFGLLGGEGGLGPDDDNFLTREAFKRGWLIKYQETRDCVIETTIGDESISKFRGQLVRWARTTFRSNPCMLINDRSSTLDRMPFTYVAVYQAALFNFALLWDAAIVWSYCHSWRFDGLFSTGMYQLVGWMMFTKIVKILPHFARHPEDFPLIIFQILFAYLHSFVKFWALITFWDCAWAGRNLDAIDAESEHYGYALDETFSWAENSAYGRRRYAHSI